MVGSGVISPPMSKWDCESQRRADERAPHRRGRPIRYRVVTDALRERVSKGELPAGVRLPTLRELAAEFKVSINTVRNAIRILEREGGLYHVPDVGTFVRPPGTASSRSALALIAMDLGRSFEAQVALGVEHACQEREWDVQILDSRLDAELESRNLRRVMDSGARGAIVMPLGDDRNLEAIFQLKLRGFPLVLIDRGLPGLRVDRVESDHEQAAYLACRHLIGCGHEHVYLAMEPLVATCVQSVVEGFERALREEGLEPVRALRLHVDGGVDLEGRRAGKRWLGGREAALPVLRRARFPVGIIAQNEYISWGVLEACRELGLSVPREVSIVSLHDSELARAMTPALTAVAPRLPEIGRRAVELLEERLPTPELEPRYVRMPVELRERASVAHRDRGSG